MLRRIATLLLTTTIVAQNCKIIGKDIGVCRNKKDIKEISFCANNIADFICVPIDRQVWSQYSIAYRDSQVEKIFIQNLQEQFVREYEQKVAISISNNRNCYQSYKEFLCRWNFPQCSRTGQILSVCNSVCQNYYRSCNQKVASCKLLYANMNDGLRDC